jgi:hypothetical protein
MLKEIKIFVQEINRLAFLFLMASVAIKNKTETKSKRTYIRANDSVQLNAPEHPSA